MLILSIYLYIYEAPLVRRSFTIKEDEEDAWVGELLSTQKVNVFNAKVKSQFDNGTVLHVSGDVGHQSQVLHKTTGLKNQTTT